MNAERNLTLVIGALGGEGGGVLADWIVETAHAAGYPVQATSIPGVAQRTGATTYYIELFPVKRAELGVDSVGRISVSCNPRAVSHYPEFRSEKKGRTEGRAAGMGIDA